MDFHDGGCMNFTPEQKAERLEFVNHLRSDLGCADGESIREGIKRLKARGAAENPVKAFIDTVAESAAKAFHDNIGRIVNPLKAEIDRLRKALEEKERDLQYANDDLVRLDGACWLCLSPEVEDAWRHDHSSDDRFHWHHRLDPGDGLVSDCSHSEMYERIWDEAQVDQKQQLAAKDAEILELSSRRLAMRLSEAEAENKRLREACKAVEEWWLREGMKESIGAPAAIFMVRAALSADEGKEG